MRIVSLLPSATEIVYALDLQDELVGITHECDYPPGVESKPVLIESCLGDEKDKLSPGEIDRRIRETVQKGEGVYRFKPGALEQAKPELVITQGLCDVCAVPHSFVINEIRKAKLQPQLISLDPQDLTGILTDIRRVGEMTGRIDKAGEVVDALEERVGEVAGRTRDLPSSRRPRVAVIEWTDPLYAAGHWVPEMIELAGGVDVLAKAGEPSRTVEWDAVLKAQPEILILAPCGYDLQRARGELKTLQSRPDYATLPAVKNGRVFIMNATATLSRPGPRIVDGLEDLAQIIHPEIFMVPAGGARWEKA
ncbi:MAG TPA: cobalamin-binding protein [Planctomycetota bacterium]|nr:cobalamin-binding protein [Planctomycetota bacterium]